MFAISACELSRLLLINEEGCRVSRIFVVCFLLTCELLEAYCAEPLRSVCYSYCSHGSFVLCVQSSLFSVSKACWCDFSTLNSKPCEPNVSYDHSVDIYQMVHKMCFLLFLEHWEVSGCVTWYQKDQEKPVKETQVENSMTGHEPRTFKAKTLEVCLKWRTFKVVTRFTYSRW
jgi:hypothetical protein